MNTTQKNQFITKKIMIDTIKYFFINLNPKYIIKNPVMFIIELGLLTTLFLVICPEMYEQRTSMARLYYCIVFIILFTITLFTNFKEAVSEGMRKTQSETLKKLRKDTQVKLLCGNGKVKTVNASDTKKGDIVLVEMGDIIPMDGEVIEGIAYVDESAITGESVPVIKEAIGDFNSVISGTKVVNNWLKIKITTNCDQSFITKVVQTNLNTSVTKKHASDNLLTTSPTTPDIKQQASNF